ncbi:hypothetical protein GTO89_06380 [Heliobacterium gestii]|uniref:Uncharacterized protein n=1 Tax=Heliomicrobium gestii TaxID=2699 RepID=A0A845LBH7_HELGE|nr:hypothetical protein [Heliomicrobium gestii]MBM7866004.1 hypothetical protein [Heliomicrobium gestii]MZP42664.1 hypothetical protein [Heliomicrobium gestii]
MSRQSMDAIRVKLNELFPSIPSVYIGAPPAGFARPAFCCRLIAGKSIPLNRTLWQERATWKIIYYPPQDAVPDGETDDLQPLTVASRIWEHLSEEMTLSSPGGARYRIVDGKISTGDGEARVTFALETEWGRAEPVYETVGEIDHQMG